MNERINQLRNYLELTQEEFGKRIGSARNTIANYEMGKRNPSNAVVISICREFNVNEDWLRNGIGKMFNELPEDDLVARSTKLLGEKDPGFEALLTAYSNLSMPNRKVLVDFLMDFAKSLEKKE